jgi:hypothetical protein
MKSPLSKILLALALSFGISAGAQATTLSNIPNISTLPTASSVAGVSYQTSDTAFSSSNISLSNLASKYTGTTKVWGYNNTSGNNVRFSVKQYDLGNGITLSLSHNASIQTVSWSGSYLRPDGKIWGSPYLAMQGADNKGIYGTAIFSFANNKITTFSFRWGSIDTYNYIIVTNYNGASYKISGADLIASNYGKTTKYFSLTDAAGFKQIVLYSCCNAFEIDQISATPLPGAFGLFGMALIGLGGLRRRFGLSV